MQMARQLKREQLFTQCLPCLRNITSIQQQIVAL